VFQYIARILFLQVDPFYISIFIII
jgi:hypothetical protein